MTCIFLKRTVVTPVVDLSAKNRPSKSTFLRPHKTVPLGDGPPLSFIPKALKEDKVCSNMHMQIKNIEFLMTKIFIMEQIIIYYILGISFWRSFS